MENHTGHGEGLVNVTAAGTETRMWNMDAIMLVCMAAEYLSQEEILRNGFTDASLPRDFRGANGGGDETL